MSTMKIRCRHKETRTVSERCFSGPVSREKENRAAHGNITVTEECTACKQRRRLNINGRHVEFGDWGE
jgi:hypothetical protein